MSLSRKVTGAKSFLFPSYIFGFCFYRLWWSEMMTDGTVTVNPGYAHLGTDYIVFLSLGTLIFSILAAFFRKRALPALTPLPIILASIVTSLGTALSIAPGLEILSTLFCGLGFIALTVLWAQFGISRFSENLALNTLVGFLIAAILTTIFNYIPLHLVTPFFSSFPLISGTLLIVSLPSDNPKLLNDSEQTASKSTALLKMLLFAALTTVATTLSNLYTITEIATLNPADQEHWSLFAGLFTLPVSALIIMSLAYSFFSKRSSFFRIDWTFRFLLILVTLGSLLAVIPDVSLWIYFIPTACGRFCFEIFFWILFLMVSTKTARAFSFFAFGRAAVNGGLLAGTFLRSFLSSQIDPFVSEHSLFIIISVFIVAAMLITYVFIFSDRALISIIKADDKSDSRGAFERHVDKIANIYGLSPRETQVFTLLAEGRDGPYIQKHLHLSRGTVSTYKQRIYQKLNIKSAQDLIECVHTENS